MKKLLTVLVVVAGLMFGSAAMAKCHSMNAWMKDDVETGVESILKGEDEKNERTVVFTTVTTFSSSTYGSAELSGTSGCGENETAYIQQQKFVAFTIDNLSEQIAQGGGPHLQSLSALLGCPASDYSKLAAITRQSYEQLFPSADTEPEVFLIRLITQMADSPELSENCVYI